MKESEKKSSLKKEKLFISAYCNLTRKETIRERERERESRKKNGMEKLKVVVMLGCRVLQVAPARLNCALM